MAAGRQSEGRLFRASDATHRNAHLDWLGLFTRSVLPEGFKVAADRLVTATLDDPHHPDVFLYPVAFLYRHALELQLKDIILDGSRLMSGCGPGRKATGHGLGDLWREAKVILQGVWPNADASKLRIVEEAIGEFDRLDRHGQAFRYVEDRQGNQNLLSAPRVVCLENLRCEMNEVFELLAGCSLGLRQAWEDYLEFLAESGQGPLA